MSQSGAGAAPASGEMQSVRRRRARPAPASGECMLSLLRSSMKINAKSAMTGRPSVRRQFAAGR